MTGDATRAVDAGVLTVKEAAAVLGCSPQTVRRLARERGLPVLRHGTWMRVPRHALNQWMLAAAREQPWLIQHTKAGES